MSEVDSKASQAHADMKAAENELARAADAAKGAGDRARAARRIVKQARKDARKAQKAARKAKRAANDARKRFAKASARVDRIAARAARAAKAASKPKAAEPVKAKKVKAKKTAAEPAAPSPKKTAKVAAKPPEEKIEDDGRQGSRQAEECQDTHRRPRWRAPESGAASSEEGGDRAGAGSRSRRRGSGRQLYDERIRYRLTGGDVTRSAGRRPTVRTAPAPWRPSTAGTPSSGRGGAPSG